jgi:hypothetical protein
MTAYPRSHAEESAVLVCGIYVDLNPIRAGEVAVPQTVSSFDREHIASLARHAQPAAASAWSVSAQCSSQRATSAKRFRFWRRGIGEIQRTRRSLRRSLDH